MRNEPFLVAAYRSTMEPFTIAIPEADLADLRARLRATRWPQPLAGPERGVTVDALQELVAYWLDEFDWRAQERALNAFPQFTTTIDGQRIHFIHARSKHADALPLILTHGWPSSPFEYVDLIEPLTEAGFDVVIPSLPGYGFSNPVSEPGWGNLFRVAAAWKELMDRLGYEHFAVHGTDVGSGVAELLGMIAADRITGVHVSGTTAAMPFGPPLELDGLSAGDRARAERFNHFREHEAGYLHIQATRPSTLAYGLTDSPAAQLAWIADRMPEAAVGRDRLLLTASLYWFTGSGATSAHGTYDGMKAWREIAGAPFDPPPMPPKAVAVFGDDTTIRSLMPGEVERWTEFDTGGHFAALETPELLLGDLREFFASQR